MNKIANVEISFINPPKPGKKMGSIKTRDNVLYWVYADKLAQFQKGPCTIEYSDDPGSDGKPFMKALGVVAPNGGPTTGPATTYTQVHTPPRPQNGNGGNYRPTAPIDAERMFVTNQLNAEIQSGKLSINSPEYVVTINKLRSAWAATFGADE